jgi:hypothetical protein
MMRLFSLLAICLIVQGCANMPLRELKAPCGPLDKNFKKVKVSNEPQKSMSDDDCGPAKPVNAPKLQDV